MRTKKARRETEKKTVRKNLEGPYQSPKGMRDLLGEEYYAFQGFAERASEIAIYYGFTPIETPILEQENVFVRGLGEGTDVVSKELYNLKTKSGDRLVLRPEYTAGIMRAYIEHGMQSLPQPVMLYSAGTLYRHDKPQKGRYREYRTFNFEIIGSEKSINDATIIKMSLDIISESGIKELALKINSIGDKDCRPNYRKELTNYYRKHLGKVCADCMQRFKINPLRMLDCKELACNEIKTGAPNSISFLCEPCREHLRETLEYLEDLNIEYSIDHTLVRGLDYYTRTAFEIAPKLADDSGGSDALVTQTGLSLGGGGRYDYLGKILGANKNIPAVGVGLGTDRIIELADKSKITPRVVKKPKVFFIQLGSEAKLKSLAVIESLREAKIPVAHSISKDSLASQLAVAEKLQIPFTIILGQKEVLDKTVLVRDMNVRSQKSVPLSGLAHYLKELAKK